MSLLDSMRSRLGLSNQQQWENDAYAEDDGYYEDDYDDGVEEFNDMDELRIGRSSNAYSRRSSGYRPAGDDARDSGSHTVQTLRRGGSRGADFGSVDWPSPDIYDSPLDDKPEAPAEPEYDWRGKPRTTGAERVSEPEFMRNRAGSPRRSQSDENLGRSIDDILISARANTSVTRNPLKIVTPISYNDAEGICNAFKNEMNVAVSLSNIKPEQAKRVLDFSFGVVSALGGTVEKVAERVYLLSHSATGITEDEGRQLREAGLMK